MPQDQSYAEALKRIEEARKTRATELYLSELGLKTLPPEIGQLSSLQTLGLSNDKLATLPDWVGQLGSLQRLHLFNNQLTTLPDSIGQLSSLQVLDLGANQLVTLPDSIGRLSSLEKLDLSRNQLPTLPDSLRELTSLRVLWLHDNPALKLPQAVLGKQAWEPEGAAKPADILDYYFGTVKAAKPLLEGKLILVGRGAVGKTSLVKRLVDNTFDPEEKMTEGIRITEWPLKLGRGETARMNVWDFGGQEIMHSTHQFFLTERSLWWCSMAATASKTKTRTTG